MDESIKVNCDLESLVSHDKGSKRLIYSPEYGPARRKDKPKPFPTDGPRIEPESFYGMATFEDIGSYFVIDRYLRIKNQTRTAESLGIGRRTFTEWNKHLIPPEEILSELARKYSLPELPAIEPESFYGKENLYKIMQHVVNQRVFNSETGKEAALSLDIDYLKMIRWMKGEKGKFFYRRKEVLVV